MIFNVDYRPGSKKSKFDMTLIRHSSFKLNNKLCWTKITKKSTKYVKNNIDIYLERRVLENPILLRIKTN